jgi:aminoglycoside phosphotransferase (APT) family kinase protein
VLAVLDWELSTLGDPLADFTYVCMAWDRERQAFRGGDVTARRWRPELEEVVGATPRRPGGLGT